MPIKQIILKGTSEYQPKNIFENTISQINGRSDMKIFYKGIKRIFEESLSNDYEIDLLKEAMCILIKIFKVNSKFLDELYTYDYDFNFILIITCHHIAHYSAKEGGKGLTYLNLSFLAIFSEYRGFCIGLNEEYKSLGSVDLAYTDTTFSDCFIVFMHDVITAKTKKLDELDLNLLGIFANLY